jgi:SOS-response transcriptional repressor LexA
MSTETLAPATRTLPVPVDLVGPRAFAVKVQGYEMTGDDIGPGDIVLIDPGKPARDGDLACITITLNGRRGKILRRIRQEGRVLESSNPGYPDIPVGPENKPRSNGRAVAVIRRLE